MIFCRLHDWLNRNSPKHAMLRVIEADLLVRPNDWQRSEYTATNHKRRLCIWIANSAWGLALHDGTDYRASNVSLSGKWRRRLWRAVNRHNVPPEQAREIVERFKEPRLSDNVISFKHGTNA